MKFNRTFSMSVQVSDDFDDRVTAAFPLTVNFKITRGILAPANSATFQIMNLSKESRDKIRKDRYDVLKYRQVVFTAGYEDQKRLPVAFQGNIVQAYSYRNGVDWVTEIEAWDGGFAMQNGNVVLTKPTPYDAERCIREIASTMPHASVGGIGKFSASSSRGAVFEGKSWSNIQKIAGQDTLVFMDNEKIYVLGKDEFLSFGIVPTISSQTGLIGSPRRYNSTLDVTVLFEPSLHLCQEIYLDTEQEQFKGSRRILGVSHRGTISGSACGNAYTFLNLDFSQDLVNMVKAA